MNKIIGIIKKINFLITRPSVLLIFGNGASEIAEADFQILKKQFSVQKISAFEISWVKKGKEFLIFSDEGFPSSNLNELKFIIKNSARQILVFTDDNSEKEENIIKEIIESLSGAANLIFNFNNSFLKKLKNEASAKFLNYGYQEDSDFKITDINKSEKETNFKINYKGYTVPFWSAAVNEEKKLNNIFAAICAAEASGINLVEISQILKNL